MWLVHVVVVVVVVVGLEVSSAVHVPRCCPDHQAYAHQECSATTHAFQPPIILNGGPHQMEITKDEAVEPACLGDDSKEMIVSLREGEAMLLMHENGGVTLYWVPVHYSVPIFQEVQDFCVALKNTRAQSGNESQADVEYVAKLCYLDPEIQQARDTLACATASCVRKCCPEGQSLRENMCWTVGEGQDWEPKMNSSGDIGAPDLVMVHGPPRWCTNMLVYEHDEFHLESTGVLALEGLYVTHQDYCIETHENFPSQPVALVCFEESETCEWKHIYLQPVLMGVSCVCLALTWLVYVCVPELRTRNWGRCLLSFVTALFIAFVMLIILGSYQLHPTFLNCVVAGRVGHFTILASFFWMNVLSYHTYTQLRSATRVREGTRVFLFYSLYAWGSPLLLVLLGVVLDATHADTIRPHILLPNCWFRDASSLWAYHYGPLLLLLLVNVGFFVSCVVVLRRRQLDQHSPDARHQTVSSWMYLKLFIITGVLWLTEVLVWFASNQCSIPVVIVDAINYLQGVYVFLVAVCFRKDLKVFHWGLPRLIPGKGGGEAPRAPGEVTELVSGSE